jgi:hypothetical protein
MGFSTTSEFIAKVQEERDEFCFDIMSLRVDELLATTPMQTEEKITINEASIPKSQLFADKIKVRDIEFFEKGLLSYFVEKRKLANDDKDSIDKDVQEHLIPLKEAFKTGRLGTSLSIDLYKIFVPRDSDLSNSSIGAKISTVLGSKTLFTTKKGKYFGYRELPAILDVPTFTPKKSKKECKKSKKSNPKIEYVGGNKNLGEPEKLKDRKQSSICDFDVNNSKTLN